MCEEWQLTIPLPAYIEYKYIFHLIRTKLRNMPLHTIKAFAICIILSHWNLSIILSTQIIS